MTACRTLALKLLLVALAIAAPRVAAADDAAPRILHILDYVAVDYAGAVKEGQVQDQGEYAEQLEFVTQARAMVERLPARPQQAALIAEASRLVAFVTTRRSPDDVARLATQLRWAIINAYGVEIAPRRPPDLATGAALYAARCAACHGAEGRGDGAAAKALHPPPPSFVGDPRMRQRSVYGVFSTITLGVDGTAMASFRELPEDQRWALAFHVANLAPRDGEVRKGASLWSAGSGRQVFGDLAAVATRSAAEVEAQHGADAAAILSFLRTRPDVFATTTQAALATSTRLLRESVSAYRDGQGRRAHDLAVSSYLEGFELVEPSLDVLDRDLRTTVETEMLAYRALLRDGAPVSDVEAKAAGIGDLLERARRLLESGSLPPGATFVSALVILLREGLEAILVVTAIFALLVRAGRRDALPYIHGGWIAALLLGAVTWGAASYVVRISGATREMTEGVTALVSAAVLLYVGFWMHGKSHARQWQAYLARRLQGALTSRTMWALALVSFLAVYREVFETVLFYEALAVQAGPAGVVPFLGGLLSAAVILLVVGWLIFRGSVRLPLGLFFGASSGLLALLAVVFAGKGIAALQEAGWLSIHAVRFPALPLLGVYPNLQGLLLQAVLIVVIATGFAYMQYAHRQTSVQARSRL